MTRPTSSPDPSPAPSPSRSLDAVRLRVVGITDRLSLGEDWMGRVEAALAGGLTAVMLREKDLTGAKLHPLAVRLREATRRAGAALIVNDRLDVALAVEADAVHLGWTSLPVEAARRAAEGRCAIGVSTHTLDALRQAAAAGADYATFSPVFPTPSKAGRLDAVGIEGLREAVRAVAIPVVALGGIEEANAGACIAAGAAGVAAIRGVFGAPNPEAAARRFLTVVEAERARRASKGRVCPPRS